MNKEENEYYDNLNKAIKQLPKICEQAHKAFEKMFKESPRILLETKKAIQDMPEDKFVEFCNKLEPRQQELAYRMRGGIDEASYKQGVCSNESPCINSPLTPL